MFMNNSLRALGSECLILGNIHTCSSQELAVILEKDSHKQHGDGVKDVEEEGKPSDISDRHPSVRNRNE